MMILLPILFLLGRSNSKNIKSCSQGCSKCNEDGTICSECSYGYGIEFQNGVSTGKCKACSSDCEVCYDDSSKCTKCYNGFIVVNNISCVSCPDDCSQCSTPNNCTECDYGFGVVFKNGIMTGQCKPCNEDCENCKTNQSFCTSCRSGYTKEKVDDVYTGKCLKCPDNCENCDENLACQKCNLGYTIENVDGISSGNCIKCPDNCNYCNEDPAKCTSCKSGYGPEIIDGTSTGLCTKCTENCNSCDDDASSCNSCEHGSGKEYKDGFYTGKCKPCKENCESCYDNYEICESCKYTYGKEIIDQKETGKCIKCPENCDHCFNDATVCTSCASYFGFEHKDGVSTEKCIPCPDKCDDCSNDASICQKCSKRYYKDEASGKCLSCPKHCRLCENYKCTECQDGFEPNENGECVKCPENCKTCINSICIECNEFYGFFHENGVNTNKCVACSVKNCENCQTDSTVCYQCSDSSLTAGFVIENGVNSGRCERCQVEHCDECNSDHSKCESCDEGYALVEFESDKYKCVQCTPNCEKCYNQTHCLSCDVGYNLFTVDGEVKCLKCLVENCSDCSNNISICSRCRYDFIYNESENKCILENVGLEHCAKSYDGINCVECSYGYGNYYENGFNTGKCVKCTAENCRDCWYDSTFCVECLDGFGFSKESGECVPCTDKHCEICQTDNTECHVCRIGYCFDNNKDSLAFNKCIKCDGTETNCNVEGCEECKENTTDECKICFSPLSLVDGKCVSIDISSEQDSSQIIDQTSEHIITQPPPPTKPPVNTQNITLDQFVDDDKVTINMDSEDFTNDVVYIVEIPKEYNKITLDSKSSKSISLVLSEETDAITISSKEGSNQIVDIIPKSDEITITLDQQTKASISDAKGIITLQNTDNQQINLNQIIPQSKDFTLIPNTPVKIEEVEFTGQQGLNIESTGNNVEVEKIKIQAHSSGSINNAVIKNIVLGPLSSLNIDQNVDMTKSNIDLSYNNDAVGSDLEAAISGVLETTPASISFNQRGFGYIAEKENDNERFLIAESASSKFNCDGWAELFRKGPFNSKFNDAECKDEKAKNMKNTKRLYAIVKKEGGNDDGDEDEDNKGLEPGAIAGIVIAVVVVVGVVIGLLVYFLVIKKRKNSENSTEQEADEV